MRDELHSTLVRRRVSVAVEDAQHGDRCLICRRAVEEMMMVATRHLREGDRVVALAGYAASCCWRNRRLQWGFPCIADSDT